jgi:hypothetical protein
MPVINFYADNGRYDIKFSGTGITSPFTISEINIFNPFATFIDVSNYGVRGNGNDDTIALQAAFDNYIPNVPIVYPAGTGGASLISSTLKANNKINFIFVCGLGISGDSYSGEKCKLNWTGSANKKMFELVNSASPLIRGFEFNYSNGTQVNGAAWGIFATCDFDIGLTGITTSVGNPIITISGSSRGSIVGNLPNGDTLINTRNITLTGAGVSGATLSTTVLNVVDSTHITLAVAPSTAIAGTGTGTIISPYGGTYVGTSPKIEDCLFNWSNVSGIVNYRAGIVFDLYDGVNQERNQITNITVIGNGGSSAKTSSDYGIGIYSGHGYASSSFNGPTSPISSSYIGGSNLLQCSADHVFFYGVSFGFHSWCGTANHIQGSYINVAFFGKWPTIISDSRFEENRQFANGFGNTTFISNQWASAVAGVSLIEVNASASNITFLTNRRDTSAFDGTSTKLFHNNYSGLVNVNSFGTDFIDTTLTVRAGTNFTNAGGGSTNIGIIQDVTGDLIILGNNPFKLPRWNSALGALPSIPNGNQYYCDDCVKGGNPCAFSGTGSIATRINGVWRCD